MLRIELSEIINKNNVWAFIGSGVSVDSGYPTWEELLKKVVESLDEPIKTSISKDKDFEFYCQQGNLIDCFSIIEQKVGLTTLHQKIITEINKRHPYDGELIKLVTDLPFAGYITTNYDNLIEGSLRNQNELGWQSIGNTLEESRKISGGVSKRIWHIHGSASLGNDKSKLIVTRNDYDQLYNNNSLVTDQIKGLLSQHRIVFIGFSFRDPGVEDLLKRVGKLTDQTRPSYAFVSDLPEAKYREMSRIYNTEVISYRRSGYNHKELIELLKTYGSMILRRSLKFGHPTRECPSYAPETTGLLVYNEFCLKGGMKVQENILTLLIKARVLSLLKHHGEQTLDKIINDLNAQVGLIGGNSTSGKETPSIKKALDELTQSNLIIIDDKIKLSSTGCELVNKQADIAETLSEKFDAVLYDRAYQKLSNDESAKRVAKATESFIKSCIKQRSLGVAMAICGNPDNYQLYHIVALLQSLPDFMPQLADAKEAMALVSIVQDILSKPYEEERKYIGLSLQARFGVHLLGYDEASLVSRIKELSQTFFLIDSSTLIPFLAKSSGGHKTANMLINRLTSIQSMIGTTTLLLTEVAEHARYAINQVEATGNVTIKTLKASFGLEGARSNAFLEGFVQMVSNGDIQLDFSEYLVKSCTVYRKGGNILCQDSDIEKALNNKAIGCRSFSKWDGFKQDFFVEKEELKKKIEERRKQHNTFKHDRQVEAESEALIIIRNIRNGIFTVDGKKFTNAYFISHTRVIDDVAGSGIPITMRPEAIMQLLSTIKPCTLDEIELITNNLLWELNEKNLNIVDKSTILRTFSPLISGTKEKYQEEIAKTRQLMAIQFGETTEKAFNELDDFKQIIIWDNYNAQKVSALEQEKKGTQKQIEELQSKKGLEEKERQEFARLKSEKEFKRRRARGKSRSKKRR